MPFEPVMPRSEPAPAQPHIEVSPCRSSSGDSHETWRSDPKKWFDHSNQNPAAILNNNIIDIDLPFFQKESHSSDSEKPYSHNQYQRIFPKLTTTHSSSDDDYRSVIDDLTVEIQRLRETLKRYKQTGPDMVRKDELFEIKVHGLPKEKKRELEATLRDFVASLDRSPDAPSSQRKKKPSRHNGDHIYSGSEIQLKHAYSSSSNLRQADSAYASMTTGAKSSTTSLSRTMMPSTESSKQKVENYLRDIPDGLYSRYLLMTSKELKNVVVRRLEQFFMDKISGHYAPRKQSMRSGGGFALTLVAADAKTTDSSAVHEPPALGTEPIRSGGPESTSNSKDHTDIGGNGNSTVSGTYPSLPMLLPPEQRPTRLCDLDTHRDADGWVYLNLLYDLAQLHMINVTPDFVRSAVSEISTKFQLSPDGRKIRWLGGSEGTKFSSDSSDYNSPKSPSIDGIDGSEKKYKRQKTSRSTGNEFQSGSSSKNAYNFGTKLCATSESFHSQPLFVQQGASGEQAPEPASSFGPAEGCNPGESEWGLNCAGEPTHRNQRHEGVIIYYSGAPFCIDLLGEPGDMSPTTHSLSGGQNQKGSQQPSAFTWSPRRTSSESFINYRPLSDRGQALYQQSSAIDEDNHGPPGLKNHDSEQMSDIELDLIWTNDQQYMEYQPLEPCGLGGVSPEDHFMVLVTTKRPKQDVLPSTSKSQIRSLNKSTEGIIHRLATISTSCPDFVSLKTKPSEEPPPVEVEYESRCIKRLAPVPLPSPAIFFPPFSSENSTPYEDDDASTEIASTASSEKHVSRQANSYRSDGHLDVSNGVEHGEDSDESSRALDE